LPELIGLYEDHAAHRDRFAVFAVHDQSVQSFAELDKKLPAIKAHYWQGKDLPFPVLLDAAGKTEKLYGIRGHPTGLLIDPDGKLVGEATAADLEAKLPPLSAAIRWARHRDMQKNVHWAFEPDRHTPAKLAEVLKRWTNCPVELDADTVRACGLTPEGPLPGVLIGGPVTLRSIDELLLAPHGLGVAPSADGKKLLITRRPGTPGAASYLQKLRATELSDRLDRGPAAAERAEAKPLEIRDQPLLDAVKLVGREFDLPVALDAKAMSAKKLDPNAKVSGSFGRGDLRKSLVRMLDPLGLTVEVRHEVVFVTPRVR
jgi:hypothetical protein